MYKFEVDPSMTKDGRCVRFVGLEHLTTVGPLGAKRKGLLFMLLLLLLFFNP